MVVGTCAYLVSIAIQTSWGNFTETDPLTGTVLWAADGWYLWVGWGGWVNALVSTAYMFMDKSDEEKEEDCLSSVLVCVTFAFSFIAQMGFVIWKMLWTVATSVPVLKAALIFDIFGVAFSGFSALCCWYRCKQGKMGFAVAGALSFFLAAAMHSKYFESGDSAYTNAFAFKWIVVVTSMAAVVSIFMKK